MTAYDVEQARNLEGEKEITAHFEKKRGFNNMEYDSKSSKTKQKDGTVVVKSNCTCVTDGTFLDFFQPKDGCDPTYGEELHKTVKKFEAEQSFVYIGADSTAVNTGLTLTCLFLRKGIKVSKKFYFSSFELLILITDLAKSNYMHAIPD